MKAVRVEIVRWVDDHQPGIVECRLTDRHGRAWAFIEKLPVVSNADLDGRSGYPQPGVIACEILNTRRDASGREFTVIDTERSWGIGSAENVIRFEVFTDDIVEAWRSGAGFDRTARGVLSGWQIGYCSMRRIG